MNSDRFKGNRLAILLGNKANLIIILSAFIILFVTLLPFNFAIPRDLSLTSIIGDFKQKTDYKDFVSNIILFIPFGLGIGAWLQKYQTSIAFNSIVAFIVSFFLSLVVEIGQVFLISREPTIYDLISNGCGGLLGITTFLNIKKFDRPLSRLYWRLRFLNRPTIKLKTLIISWLSYLFVICLILITVADSTKLSNWDTRYPLLVGNEATGDRFWQGKITDFCITKKAIPQQQIEQLLNTKNSCVVLKNNSNTLITTYFFNRSHPAYLDLTRNLPNLDNQSKLPFMATDSGIIIDRDRWLKTTFPATKLSKEIQQSSQFTILMNIATNSLQQSGPARIISLSQNHLVRNFTIAQSERDLSIRIRTPLMGLNGKNPEIRVNDFFKDREFQQIAISYDSLKLKIYFDEPSKVKSLYFGSEAALFWSVFSILSSKVYLNIDNNNFYFVLYYGVMFVPLGIFLGAIIYILNPLFSDRLKLVLLGIGIPPFLVETIIVSSENRDWNWQYLSLSMTILIISFCLTKVFNLKKNY